MMDTSKFMLLSPSANRAKSWACEHCVNWSVKDVQMCTECYYASPEDYKHIAGSAERRLDIVFRKTDLDVYDMIIELSKNDNITTQEAFKRIARYAKKYMMKSDGGAVEILTDY